MLQALFAFDWETWVGWWVVVVERNAQMTFLTAVVGQAKRESPVKRERPLFARAQTLPGAAWLAAAPLHIPPHDL